MSEYIPYFVERIIRDDTLLPKKDTEKKEVTDLLAKVISDKECEPDVEILDQMGINNAEIKDLLTKTCLAAKNYIEATRKQKKKFRKEINACLQKLLEIQIEKEPVPSKKESKFC